MKVPRMAVQRHRQRRGEVARVGELARVAHVDSAAERHDLLGALAEEVVDDVLVAERVARTCARTAGRGRKIQTRSRTALSVLLSVFGRGFTTRDD